MACSLAGLLVLAGYTELDEGNKWLRVGSQRRDSEHLCGAGKCAG